MTSSDERRATSKATRDHLLNHPPDRRRFNRRDSSSRLAVEIASSSRAAVRGAIHNISRGGMLLRLREVPLAVAETRHCVVRFVEGVDGVRPAVSRGRILRSDVTGSGVQLAIEFSEPLVSLRP